MEQQALQVSDPALPAVQEQPQNVLAIIAGVAQRGADPTVLHQLLDFQERVEARDAEKAYTASMIELKDELPRIRKDGKIELGGSRGAIKFAKYEDIHRAVKPLLAKHGFALSYSVEPAGEKTIIVLTIKHRAGHSQQFRSVPLLIGSPGPGRNAAQEAGSVFSYGKRYVLCAALDIVTEDEDNDAMGAGTGHLPLTKAQLDDVKRRLADYQVAETRILKWLNAPTIEEIRQADFGRLILQLDKQGSKK